MEDANEGMGNILQVLQAATFKQIRGHGVCLVTMMKYR